jgi:DDE superfamily endonuclease
MSRRKPASPAPDPLQAFAVHFDPLFSKLNQRVAFRRYLQGLLLPAERNKTLTALANTAPTLGAQDARAQGLQWFLSESTWDPAALSARRLELLRHEPTTAPTAAGVLVIDETGDRKAGTKTAHVGRQYLANVGKIDNGVVSVTSLWADDQLYFPLAVEPYTPKHWFAQGSADPAFRTKPQIALALITRAVAAQVAFRAVVADSFYGENHELRNALLERRIPFVLALQPSHTWWHPIDTLGALGELALAAGWQSANEPGAWQAVERTFGDGHRETWWALEVVAGPYGPQRARRAVVATTDPGSLPDQTTWYLTTNLPTPGHDQALDDGPAAADVAEVVRLYGLRMWVEQSYKQVKQTLGWAQYQVRSDLAIRRHWELVCCAFCFCWWHAAQHLGGQSTTGAVTAVEKKKRRGRQAVSAATLADGVAAGSRVVGAVDHAVAVLAGLVAPPATGRAPGRVADVAPGRGY